jgi:hypothetical protein
LTALWTILSICSAKLFGGGLYASVKGIDIVPDAGGGDMGGVIGGVAAGGGVADAGGVAAGGEGVLGADGVASKLDVFAIIADALFSNPSRGDTKNNLLNARETNITSNRKTMVDDFPTGVPKIRAIYNI